MRRGREKRWVRDFTVISVKTNRCGQANIPPDLNPLGPPQTLPPGHRGLLSKRVPSERVTRAFPLPPRAMLHVDALAADTRVTSSWVLCALCLRSDR